MTKIGFRIPGALGKKPLTELMQWAADNGFGAIDIGRPDKDTVDAAQKAGLIVGTFDLGRTGALLSADAEERRANAESIQDTAARAKDLGLTRAFGVFLPPDSKQSRGASFANWSEGWPAASEALAAAGVDFCLEGWPGGGPHYPALGVTPETVRAMLVVDKERGAGALKLNYDPSHLVRIGVDPLRFLSEFGGSVRHAHGKDTALDANRLYETGNLGASLPDDVSGSAQAGALGFGEGWWRYCIPGDGAVDWAQVAAGLSAHGFDGTISVELEDGRYNGSLEGEEQGVTAFAGMAGALFRVRTAMPEEKDHETSLIGRNVAQNNWAQARADMATATTLEDAGIAYAAVFFAQQTAEKALRAACIIRLGKNPRTHNVIQCADALLAPLEVMNAAAELNADYLLTRSVEAAGGIPARLYDRAEAGRHLNAARVIFDWVRLMM